MLSGLENLRKYNLSIFGEKNRDQVLFQPGRGRRVQDFLNGDGGISSDRINNDSIDCIELESNVQKLLKEGKRSEAYSLILNCGSTPTFINTLVRKYF